MLSLVRDLRLLAVLTLLLAAAASAAGPGCYTSIFSFGDSYSDTGNGKCLGIDLPLPYGETYFGYSTGRSSDGRIIVDFVAQALGLPLLRPNLGGGSAEDFRYGANFAVDGATALNASFFGGKGFSLPNSDLGTQLGWFQNLLDLLCARSDRKDILSNSLILMGVIGGNDYNFALLVEKRNLSGIKTYYSPIVVNAISDAIKFLLELGAKTLVVPGHFPIGCLPSFLEIYKTTAAEAYDVQTGCLKWLNEIAEYHNSMLSDEINHLMKLYPHATIIYADLYEATLNIYRSPRRLGFEYPFTACIDLGGELKSCGDPSAHISWDGSHFTEAAYGIITSSLLDGACTHPSFAQVCPGLRQTAAF